MGDNGEIRLYIGNNHYIESKTHLQPNKSYLISVCRENSGALKIYINGQLDVTSYISTVPSEKIISGVI